LSGRARGSGHSVQHATVGKGSFDSPQHVRDVALVQRAIAVQYRRVTAQRLAGDTDDKARKAALWVYNALKGMAAYLARSASWEGNGRVLQPRQMAVVLRVLKLDAPPPVPESAMPEVLKHLPLKPPGRGGP
jgi:hypothetical protein